MRVSLEKGDIGGPWLKVLGCSDRWNAIQD